MGQSTRTGVPQDFRMNDFELTGQPQFDGDCSEDEGDQVGFIMTCTKGDHDNGGVMSGYGNGARRPDGTAL